MVRGVVVRGGDGLSDHWSIDAIVRSGRLIDLVDCVVESGRTWPASVEVRAGAGGEGGVPMSIRVRISDRTGAEIRVERIVVAPSGTQFVGAVVSDGRRYELYVEARPAEMGPAV